MEELQFHDGKGAKTKRIVHMPSDFAKATLLYLQETGSLKAVYLHKSSRQNLDSYLFFIVQSGAGTLEYCGKSYDLSEGDCVFVDCQKPYSHATSYNLWELRWVHFNGFNMRKIYDKYLSRGGKPKFRPEHLDAYQKILDQIYEVAATQSYVCDMEINEKLSGLLVLLMRDSWDPEKNTVMSERMQIIQKVKDYIDQNFAERISLDMLSRMFFINKYYMSELFKKQYGYTINNYLLHVRIEHSKSLLRFSDLSIREIGWQCGIGEANYFSRVFKNIEGLSPGKYRKSWSEFE